MTQRGENTKHGWCTSLMATADRNTCGLTFSMARGIEDYLTATDSQNIWWPGLVPNGTAGHV